MAITMNGQTFRTLDDELYLNGQRIVAVHADGTLVYPEGEDQMAKVSGGFTYDATHAHYGDASMSPVTSSVSNHLSCSYTGTFYLGTYEDTVTLPANYAGWDVSDDDYSVSESSAMAQYGYKYYTSYSANPRAPIGTNDEEITVRRRYLGRDYIGPLAVDIDMSVPQFCQPVRVRNGKSFGKMTCRFVTDFMSTLSGHYEVNNDAWFTHDGLWSANLKTGTNVGYGVERMIISSMDNVSLSSFSIRIAATVERTIDWEYSLDGGTVTPISGKSTDKYMYRFDGQSRSTYADFYMPITNIEILNGE